jgi:hypothetical protein
MPLPSKPTHIDSHCSVCRALLVLADEEATVRLPSQESFMDEWVCPVCQDQIYLDWPSNRDNSKLN